MWNKPWNLKEGVAIVAGLLLVGLLLQFSIGPLDWVLFLWPANGITLIVLIIALILLREFGIRKGLKKLVISSKIRIFIGENQ